jgi:uncharacterized protein
MIIRFIIFLVLIYLLYRIFRYFQKPKSANVNKYKYQPPAVGGEDLVEDQFCHTYVPLSQSYKKEIAGKDYYFCSKECCESYVLQKRRERQ